jgi:alkanesulfonate monooxygenase SsuD/methylene tetrahydromethanopterin reductase-like flavin-dependent oxidoreductase (luciferase family)
MAARKGLGVLGFSVGDLEGAEKAVRSYKAAIAEAEPIGAYVNDNLMCTIAAYVGEDGREVRRRAVASRPNYLVSNVFRYHDTFPHPPEVPAWPELIPEADLDAIDDMGSSGQLVLGDPDEALATCRRWEAVGVDQLVFGIGPAPLEDTLETIRLMGEHVIPKIDTDPVHRTTRMREAAAERV